MNRHPHRLTFALFIVIVSAVPTLADDLRPPDYRFDPHSTVAGWEFLTEQNVFSIYPDADVPLWVGDAAEPMQEKFPAGAPYPSASIFGDVAYTEALGGGYFSSSSSGNNGLVFIVPNGLESQLFKRLRLQVTYQGVEPPTTVVGYAGIPGSSSNIEVLPIVRVPIAEPPILPPGSSFFHEDWLIAPSPTWEQVVVFIPEETIILHVVIDTVSVTPPAIFEDGFEPGEASPWTPR